MMVSNGNLLFQESIWIYLGVLSHLLGGILHEEIPQNTHHTVDGRNPAPGDMVTVPLFAGFHIR